MDLADEKGTYCGKLLADMGADVIKVEPPGGDAARSIPPFWRDEPHPDRGLFFLYMNTSKRGVTLDFTRREGAALLKRLARTAHIIVETYPPGYLDSLGLGHAALRESNPGLVFTSITGFGQTGPQKDFKPADIVASALGGAMYVTGEEEDPPVTLAGSQAYMMASVCAAASSLIALRHSSRTGEGQLVDVSVEETMVAVTHIAGVGKWLDDGYIPKRMGTALVAAAPSRTYPCKDGLVYLTVNRPSHWKALAKWVNEVTGCQEILEPMFEGPSSNRLPHRDLLDLYISDLTSRFTVDEIYREGQHRHIAFSPVNTAATVVADQHLIARNYFVDVEHAGGEKLTYPGAPFLHSDTPWQISRSAPRIGQHNREIYCADLGLSDGELRALEANGVISGPDATALPRVPPPTTIAGEGEHAREEREERSGSQAAIPCRDKVPAGISVRPQTPQALQGLRVLEFTAGMAGPWVGRFMAYCGAEVIRIESKQRPDVVRLYVPPWAPEMGTQPQMSPWFTDWDAGKRYVALDLTNPQAVELAKRLVGICDVVVENYSSGVIDKLGLGYPKLAEVRPDLIMLSTSGYGDSGPCRRYVSWGPNIETLSGLSTLSGFPGRDCTMTQFAYPDPVSALHGLFAVLCALNHREQTGRGQYINLSQYEATVSVLGHVVMEYLANGREPRRLGNGSNRAAPHGCYRCRGEDRWCVIAVFDDADWQRFCKVLGKPEWLRDPRFATLPSRLEHGEKLDRAIEGWTAVRDPYDVMTALQEAGVAAGVVQTVEDQFRRDRQLAARGFFEEIEHLKKGTVVASGIPLGLTATPGWSGRAGAAVGQDNDYVFGELLGMTATEIRKCVASGAIEPPASQASRTSAASSR